MIQPGYVNIMVNNQTARSMFILFKREDPNSTYLSYDIKAQIIEKTTWTIYNPLKCILIIPPFSEKKFTVLIDPRFRGSIYIADHPIQDSVPNYKTSVYTFEKIEINFNTNVLSPESYLGDWRISNQNYFGLPIQLSTRKKMETKTETVGLVDYMTRKKIFALFQNMNAVYSDYKMPKGNSNCNYRWFSPAYKDTCNIWKEAIRYGLECLDGRDFYYEAQDEKTRCHFWGPTENSIEVREVTVIKNEKTIRKFTIKNIDTFSAIQGTLFPEVVRHLYRRTPPGKCDKIPTIKSGAFIAAAINRGVLYDPDLWTSGHVGDCADQDGGYYQSRDENFGQFNLYSKLIHDHSIDQRAFGFCYDHLFVKGSELPVYKQGDSETDVTITILPFEENANIL